MSRFLSCPIRSILKCPRNDIYTDLNANLCVNLNNIFITQNWNTYSTLKNKYKTDKEVVNNSNKHILDKYDVENPHDNLTSRTRKNYSEKQLFNTRYKTERLDAKNSYKPKKYINNIPDTGQTLSGENMNDSEKLIFVEDPDSFGMITKTNNIFSERFQKNKADLKEDEFLTNIPWRKDQLSTKQYADLIKNHLEHNRIKEALDILEIKMLQEDKVKPENYIYNLLIGGCAKVGYTKKAFLLYNDMKKRALDVTGGTYTSLFNACANSPWPEDGLQRAHHLRQLMVEKAIEPNLTIYNCMIKAFGHCNDLSTAFEIVDEMCDKKIHIRVHTFNFLLQACISDTKEGFQYALRTWKKMIDMKEKPNIFSFNLMLRCIQHCKMGDLDALKQIVKAHNPNIKQITAQALQTRSDEDSELRSAKNVENTLVVESNDNINHKLPSLLSKNPNFDNIICFNEVKTPADRFMLVGGLEGILDEFNKYKVTPDIKTATQLIGLIPSTIEAEEKLIELMKSYKIPLDITFYNMLMKKRCFRNGYSDALAVKTLIDKENELMKKKIHFDRSVKIKPDIITYGVLAMTCTTKEVAVKYIEDMKNARITCNAEIMGALLKTATTLDDKDYVAFVLTETKLQRIAVNDIFITHLKKYREKCKRKLGELSKLENSEENTLLMNSYNKFIKKSKAWIASYNNVEPEHPWTQFRVNQPETFQRPQEKPKPPQRYKKPYRRVPKYEP